METLMKKFTWLCLLECPQQNLIKFVDYKDLCMALNKPVNSGVLNCPLSSTRNSSIDNMSLFADWGTIIAFFFRLRNFDAGHILNFWDVEFQVRGRILDFVKGFNKWCVRDLFSLLNDLLSLSSNNKIK